MQLSSYGSNSQLRVSFTPDNKKMIIEGKNHEKNEIKFKDLRSVDDDLAQEPKLRHNHTRIKVTNTDGKEYHVTVKTKEFAETMSHFEDAKTKDVVKDKKLSSKEKKIVSGYEESTKTEQKIGGLKEEMRKNASPKEIERFDDIDALIKEASAKIKLEMEAEEKRKEKKELKKKSGFLKKAHSRPIDKEKKTSSKPEKASVVLENKLDKMRKKANPETLKKFDEADALVAEMMKDVEVEKVPQKKVTHTNDVKVKHGSSKVEESNKIIREMAKDKKMG